MRAIYIGLVGLSICQIAAAQVPPDSLSTEDSAPTSMQSPPTSTFVPSKTLSAKTLYMCEFRANSNLYTVNAINAQVTTVGSMQTSERCTDLAFRKTASGTQLFGTSFTRIFLVDPSTGKASLLPNKYGARITDINALVAQPGSGLLFGAGSSSPGQFVQINPTSGIATRKGSYGTGLGSAGDLEFLNGQLYGLLTRSGFGTKTFLAKISLSTASYGKATHLLPIRRSINGHLVQLSDVWGLSNRSGILLAAMRTGELLALNATTGIATLKGDNHRAQAGLAISP